MLSRRQTRAFQPNLFGLEGRQLLSNLFLRQAVNGSAYEYIVPQQPTKLGYVSSSNIDLSNVGDTLKATVDWGDGTTPDTISNAGVVWRAGYANPISVPGHAFQSLGTPVYVHVTVTDQHGGSCSWVDRWGVYNSGYTFSEQEGVPVGNAYNVVGSKFRIDDMVVNTFDPTDVITVTSAVYTFTGPDGISSGAISIPSDGTPVFDQKGFHEDAIRADYGTMQGAHSYIEDYWNATPGDHTVVAYLSGLSSKNGSWSAELKHIYNITAPTASVQTQFGNTTYQFLSDPRYVDKPGWFLTSYKFGQYGITIDATLSGVTDAGGTYGIVQTVKPTSYYWDLTGQKYQIYVSSDPLGKTPSDWPLLDNDPDNPDNPYYDIVAARQYKTTWGSGEALHLIDTPRVQISTLDTKIQESDSFQDFVMFTPTGGVPVPIAISLNGSQDSQYSFTWSWGGTMIWDVDGISPNPSGLQDPSLGWTSYAVPTTPTWGNTAWYYQQNMPNGIAVA